MTDPAPDEFKRDLILECRGNHIIVNADPGRSIPPITLSVFIDSGHTQTYLTADEAAELGKTLLEAATGVIERDERPAPATYVDGSQDDLSRSLDVIADAAAVPGVER